MATQRSMNSVIHAAVRRDVARFRSALHVFPDGSAERAAQLATAWQFLQRQLTEHHQDEETIFWPALRDLGATERVVGDLDGEHRRMAAAMTVCDGAVRALVDDPTTERATAAEAAFTDLGGIVDEHFAHEEDELEAMFVERHDAPELKAAVRKVRSKLSMSEGADFMSWLVDGASRDDRAVLTADIPPPVLFVLSRFVARNYNRTVKPVWAA